MLENLHVAGVSRKESGHSDYVLNTGAYYLLDDQLGVALDLKYGPSQGFFFQTGIEYFFVPERLVLRLGLAGKGMVPAAGFGIRWNKFSLDLGSSFHPRMGMSPQFDLIYEF